MLRKTLPGVMDTTIALKRRGRGAAAADYAARMVERSHRQFDRTPRAMQDYRRIALPITIHNRGQFNVAQQQQMNASGQ